MLKSVFCCYNKNGFILAHVSRDLNIKINWSYPLRISEWQTVEGWSGGACKNKINKVHALFITWAHCNKPTLRVQWEIHGRKLLINLVGLWPSWPGQFLLFSFLHTATLTSFNMNLDKNILYLSHRKRKWYCKEIENQKTSNKNQNIIYSHSICHLSLLSAWES